MYELDSVEGVSKGLDAAADISTDKMAKNFQKPNPKVLVQHASTIMMVGPGAQADSRQPPLPDKPDKQVTFGNVIAGTVSRQGQYPAAGQVPFGNSKRPSETFSTSKMNTTMQ